MQFVITAYDGDDSEAMERRLAVREAHLAGIAPLKTTGNFIAGGAILDDDENMIGSTLYVEFPSREELDNWLINDPYVTGGVWKDISVQAIKLAFKA
mgnify:FL=1|jgi:hypothetical protein